jgi:hypothetical protein
MFKIRSLILETGIPGYNGLAFEAENMGARASAMASQRL